MTTITEKICRAIAHCLPNSALNIAEQKRNLEKAMRSEGLSRKVSKTIVADHFKAK